MAQMRSGIRSGLGSHKANRSIQLCKPKMKNNSLIVIAVALATIANATATHGRGFGGFHGGRGRAGGGASWEDDTYIPPIPTPGWNAAYGGVFSGPPQLNMKKGGGTFNPLAGEGGVQAGPQVNYECSEAGVCQRSGRDGNTNGRFQSWRVWAAAQVGARRRIWGCTRWAAQPPVDTPRGGTSVAGGGRTVYAIGLPPTCGCWEILPDPKFHGYNVFGRDWYRNIRVPGPRAAICVTSGRARIGPTSMVG